MNNYNPVHYVVVEEKDDHRQTEEGNLLVYEPGWYFWDELWSYRHGPFKTETDANDECMRYAKKL